MFVALYPPEPVVDELASALSALQRDASDAATIRWAAPSQWHLTLAFMADVPDAHLPQLAAILAAVAAERGDGPPLAVSGAGHFGQSTLWWALRPDASAQLWLGQLARAVRRGCRAAGAAPEAGRWRPHITVGRARKDAPAGTVPHWVHRIGGVTSQPWTPQELVLVASVTGPEVQHSATGRWPLGGNASGGFPVRGQTPGR